MRKNFSVLAGIILLWWVPVSKGVSQWSTNAAVNNVICGLGGEQAIPKVATCSNGDTYIGYFSNESGNYNVRLQRLDAAGNNLWAADGILISDKPQDSWLTDWDMTCDNANHAILVFNDIRTGNTNIVAYRISPTGAFAWGADGLQLSNSPSVFNAAPRVVATAAGNAVIAWAADDNVITQKISPTGTLLWGPSGILRASTNRMAWPQLLPVGTDDVIMKYFDDSGLPNAPTRHVYAQRFNASGAAVWSSPATISTAGGISAWTQIFPFINDGSDGFYMAWHDDRDNNQRASVFVQHISASGTTLFTANGVEASSVSNMNHYYPVLALPDGSTDVFVYWNEMNTLQSAWGLFGQKIDASGVPQWGSGGMTFIPVSSTDVYPYEARKSPTDMILVYEEYTTAINGNIKAMRISTTGTMLWTPAQKTICSVNSQKVHPVVNEYSDGQWIVSWEDDRNGNSDIYAQNIQLNGDLGPVATGYIQGHVTITGEPQDVSQATVTAGGVTAHPNASGNYSLTVPAGTYSVTASHPYTDSQTVSNIDVYANQPTTGVNFNLNVTRADMIVSAKNDAGGVMNGVSVLIQGPEGPYSGTINFGTLTFARVPYGNYDGTATYNTSTTTADTAISPTNHDLVFVFNLSGTEERAGISGLRVVPMPATAGSSLEFTLASPGKWHIGLADAQGRVVGGINRFFTGGVHTLAVTELTGGMPPVPGFYCIRMTGEKGTATCRMIVAGQ